MSSAAWDSSVALVKVTLAVILQISIAIIRLTTASWVPLAFRSTDKIYYFDAQCTGFGLVLKNDFSCLFCIIGLRVKKSNTYLDIDFVSFFKAGCSNAPYNSWQC
ncbi:hypothetical protein J6590_086577 [Homalodisca vitripennis]|nr:hypothetical protein J6590_086577 [Homalodisca vitripennis]